VIRFKVKFASVCGAASVWIGATTSVVFFSDATARAGESSSCHFHGEKPADEPTVRSCALKRLAKLIESKKVGQEWKSTKSEHISFEVVDGKKGKEWKATVTNPQITTDGQVRTLYMFFTHQGNFIAANFTGK
jgi:Family of unknown function (DUF6488)